MEPHFDKEIHALLHNFGRSGAEANRASLPMSHLDADELAAFAENSVPDKSKPSYYEHLAECDECRKALSSLIPLSDVESFEARAVPAALSETVPWYRTIFSFGRLAYVLGALVIAFSGLTAFVVFRSIDSGTREMAAANVASAPDELANRELQSNANTAMVNSFRTPDEVPPGISAANRSGNNVDSTRSQNKETVMPAEQETTTAKESKPESDLKTSPGNPATAGIVTEEVKEKSDDEYKVADSMIAAEPRDAAPPAPPAKPVAREVPMPSKKRSAKDKDERAKLSNGSNRNRTISGKTFMFREGVWYDSSYSGQKTTNIRRGTEEFRKLDSRIRNIAGEFTEPVVIVSGPSVYRIQ